MEENAICWAEGKIGDNTIFPSLALIVQREMCNLWRLVPVLYSQERMFWRNEILQRSAAFLNKYATFPPPKKVTVIYKLVIVFKLVQDFFSGKSLLVKVGILSEKYSVNV